MATKNETLEATLQQQTVDSSQNNKRGSVTGSAEVMQVQCTKSSVHPCKPSLLTSLFFQIIFYTGEQIQAWKG